MIGKTAVTWLTRLMFTGVIVLLIAAPLMRGLYYYTGFLQAQLLLGGITLVCALLYLFNREKKLRFSLLDLFVLAYFAAHIFSLIDAVHIKDAVFGLIKALDYTLVYFIVSRLARDTQYRNLLVLAIFLSSVVASVAAHLITLDVLSFSIPESYGTNRIFSTLEYYNAYAILAAAGLLLGLGLLSQARHVAVKAVLGGCLYLNMMGILASQSRATWIFLSLALLAYLYAGARKHFWSNLYFLLGLLAAAFLTSRTYMQAMLGGQPGGGLWAAGLGLAATVIFTVLLYQLPEYIRKNRKLRKYAPAVPWLLAATLLLVGGFYFQYLSAAVPDAAGQLISDDLLSRMESISGQDASFQQRLDMFGIAWKIVQDYPLFGAGTRGWDALYHLHQEYFFWSAEVHNHFLQVWTDTGTVGLLTYLGIWVTLLFSSYRYLKKRRGKSSWPYIWPVLLTALLLICHSAIDFDQSLPALAILLFTLAALLQGKVGEEPPGKRSLTFPVRLVAIPLLAVTILSWGYGCREYSAQLLAAEAADLVTKQQYDEAREKYEQAFTLSPYSGKWASNLAQLYGYSYLETAEPEYKERAEQYAKRSTALTPYYIPGSQMAAQAYYFIGDAPARLAEQQRLTTVAPTLVLAWEALALNHYEQATAFLETGETDSAREALLAVREAVVTADENYAAAKKYWSMRPTARLNLTAGKAALLSGEQETALEKLKAAFRTAAVKDEAGLWLALAYRGKDEKNFTKYYQEYVETKAETKAEFTRYLKLLSN